MIRDRLFIIGGMVISFLLIYIIETIVEKRNQKK